MNINVRITGTDRVVARLERLPDDVRRAVGRVVMAKTDQLYDQVIANITGEVLLGSKDGPLARSFTRSYFDDGSIMQGLVFSDGSVPYDLILERGGTTSPHDIKPINGKALAFLANGKGPIGQAMTSDMIFAMVVHHPGSVIPEFAYARRAVAGMRREITAEITAAALSRSMARAA